jgi:hypothetical protein
MNDCDAGTELEIDLPNQVNWKSKIACILLYRYECNVAAKAINTHSLLAFFETWCLQCILLPNYYLLLFPILKGGHCVGGLFFSFFFCYQVIKRTSGGADVPFEIDAFRKHCLVNGLDDIGLTLEKVGGGWLVGWLVGWRVFAYSRAVMCVHPFRLWEACCGRCALCCHSCYCPFFSSCFLLLTGGCDLGVRSETKRWSSVDV